MARLPQPGGDVGQWGGILNEYLSQAHKPDGTLSDNSVSGAALAPGAVSASSIQDGTITPPKLSTDTPANGEVLSYNGSGFEWITPAASGGGGESNTASNVGTGGVGIFKQKTGVNLEFKNINAGSNKISVTNEVGTNEIDIDVNTANLGLTKSDVGLANVDNTADASKPISTATQTALNAKADETVTVSGGTSLAGGGDLSANRTLTLVNDNATPGNSRYYGTDGSGAKGFHAIPAGGDPAVGGDLTGTASNAQIAAGAVADAEVAAGAGIAQSKIANLTTDLSNKQPLDSDLTAIAALTATNDDIIQRKAGAWTNRTPAQVKTDLALSKADVGLASVDNTADTNKPVSTATQTALNGKADTTHTHDAADIDSGMLGIDRLSLGAVILVDKEKAFYGAAGSWPASRPTSRTDIVVIWKGDTDPGSLAIAGDEWKVTA